MPIFSKLVLGSSYNADSDPTAQCTVLIMEDGKRCNFWNFHWFVGSPWALGHQLVIELLCDWHISYFLKKFLFKTLSI